MKYEYARFGDGFVRRLKDSTDDWQPVAQDDVPLTFFIDESETERRRRVGLQPRELEEGETRLTAKVVRKPNPKVDDIARELGLSSEALRERLNGAPGGTNVRVTEERFDEIAEFLGLTPEDARARFRE